MNKKLLLISPIVLITIWYIAAYFKIVNILFLPSPKIVLYKLIELITTTEKTLTIWPDVLSTLYIMLISFFISICETDH